MHGNVCSTHLTPLSTVIADLRPFFVFCAKVAPGVTGQFARPFLATKNKTFYILTCFYVGVTILPTGELADVVDSLGLSPSESLSAIYVTCPFASAHLTTEVERLFVFACLRRFARRGLTWALTDHFGTWSRRCDLAWAFCDWLWRAKEIITAREENSIARPSRKLTLDDICLFRGYLFEINSVWLDCLEFCKQFGISEIASCLVGTFWSVSKRNEIFTECIGHGRKAVVLAVVQNGLQEGDVPTGHIIGAIPKKRKENTHGTSIGIR